MPQRPIRNLIAGQKILTAPKETTVSEAARLMKKMSVGAVMVVEKEKLIGIVTERDVLFRVLAESRDPTTTRLAEVMTAKPQTIGPDRPFGHALHLMYESGFRHVPVVEHGRPVGMVSARDALGPELQEFEAELQRKTQIGEILSGLADQHRGRNLPAFGRQDVEGAAHRRRIHHFEPDSRIGQRSHEARMREAQRRAGAEQRDHGLERSHGGEIGFGQRIESAGSPAGDDPLGGHEDVLAVLDHAESHMIRTVAGEHIAFGRVEVELHRGLCVAASP